MCHCVSCTSTTTPVCVLLVLSVHAPCKQHRTSCGTHKSCAAYSTSSTRHGRLFSLLTWKQGCFWFAFVRRFFMSSVCRQRGV